jgi:hypothetical protein
VTTVATGIYQIVFSGVTPAPAEGDRYTCKVNGSIAGTAWSEYGIPVKIVADERGTDNVTSGGGSGGLDAAGVRAALGLSSANLDTQLGDLPTTSEFNARTLASADYFDFANDTVTTDTASRDASKADIAAIGTNVTAVKAKTDQMVFTNANELDVNAVTGGGGDDAATIYTYFTASSREDSFKADLTGLNDISASDVYTHFTTGANEDAFKADVTALAGVATNVTAVKAKTDQMVFTNANELDVNAVTGGTSPSDIYLYFTASSREDSFKADLTGLNDISASDVYTHFTTGANEDAFKADVAALAGVATNVTAVKSKTDQMVFTNANELDVNAVTGGTSPSDIYLYFTASSREDSFKADLTELNDISASDVYTHFTTGANEDAFKADVTLLATESILSDVKAVTEKIDTALIANGSDFRFTVDSLANAPVSDNAAAIYSYFADASRPDLFKADVSDVIRKGVSHRYTNNGGGVGFDDVTVTDTP